jgi:hypothetical protein
MLAREAWEVFKDLIFGHPTGEEDAPRGVRLICCFLTNRLATSWLMVDRESGYRRTPTRTRIVRGGAASGRGVAHLGHRCRSCRRHDGLRNLRAVQMLVVPTEGDLQCLMELRHRAIAANQLPRPNQWADTAQHRSQLVNLYFMTIVIRHGAKTTLVFRTPQQ